MTAHMTLRRPTLALAALALLPMQLPAAAPAAATQPADVVYRNGKVYTAESQVRTASALAVLDGRIVMVGGDTDARQLVGEHTQVVDLGGRMLMPGLIDGHMHPLAGGAGLLKCSLDYQALTVQAFQARIQACLDAHARDEPDRILEATYWFRYAMQPKGVAVTRATLDALHTRRPIIVEDSFGHSSLVNSRALQLAHIDAHTPDPVGGRIDRQPSGEPTGMLEDAAQDPVTALIPKPTAADSLAAARAAEQALAAQGVTAFLDAMADTADLESFGALARSGELTVRAHMAPVILPRDATDPAGAARALKAYLATAYSFDGGPTRPQPTMTVRNAKLFIDGVITAPANTGVVLEPYRVNRGTAAAPRWEPGPPGPRPYFDAPILAQLLTGLARAGIDPHMHTDGDGAVRAALDAVEAMRKAVPGADIRPGLAHCELVDPADYPRFATLRAQPVLSFQWGKPAPDTIDGARDSLGPERWARIEPAGYLQRAGARIAFGSDWPVDRLDEWFALKVAVTRTAAPDAGPGYAGRLGSDPGLTVMQALQAATLAAAYELHADHEIGSLEKGKYADFIVLDRDLATVPAADIAGTRVLRTVIGGKVVYDAGVLH